MLTLSRMVIFFCKERAFWSEYWVFLRVTVDLKGLVLVPVVRPSAICLTDFIFVNCAELVPVYLSRPVSPLLVPVVCLYIELVCLMLPEAMLS